MIKIRLQIPVAIISRSEIQSSRSSVKKYPQIQNGSAFLVFILLSWE